MHGSVAESETLHDPWPEILHEHICARHELVDSLKVSGIFKVRRKALLVPIDGVEKHTVSIKRKVGDVELTAELTCTGTFDLNYPRTEIGQAQTAGWSGKELTEIEDQQSVKRFHIFHVTLILTSRSF
jgi:hypothetical protein